MTMPPSQFALQGAGHLATALIEGFSLAHTGPISIYDRTPARAQTLAERFATLRVFEQPREFDAEPCPLLLVIPAAAILSLPADRIERLRRSGRVLVSCANGLPLSLLQKLVPDVPWVKAIPSIAAAVGKSVTLVANATPEVERIFNSIGSVVQIESDDEIDRLSVLTSCLPGILAAMLDELAQIYALDRRQTRDLLLESVLASVLVAQGKETTLADLVASVANPGGLTEAGVAVIRRGAPALLAEMKQAIEVRIRERRIRLKLMADS
jgi:pyrroline-5-carboxylate reductase